MLYSRWREVQLSTRHKIAEIFGFKKVRSTHVVNNEISDDGFNVKDIEEALALDKLQNFLNNPSTDINYLFNLTVDTLEGKMPEVIIVPEIIAKPVETVKPKKHGNTRTKK